MTIDRKTSMSKLKARFQGGDVVDTSEKQNDLLVFDMSNMLHRAFYVNINEDVETLVGFAYHTSFMTLNKYYKKYKPKRVVFVFDRGSWRKKYTKTDECISKKLYKGNRRVDMTPSQKERYEVFKKFVNEFEDMIRSHTSITCLACDDLEADDLIAGVAQVHSDKKVVIVTADQDMIQLLGNANVALIDPASDKPRTLDKWDGDAGYFIFEKCLRGDTGDNVQSAYPRVRSTRIKAAYTDDYARVTLMAETWTNQDSREMVVGELFKENKLLMDLTAQPDYIRQKIVDTIDHGFNNTGRYSHFHFLKFLGGYGLKNVAKNLEQFVPLLS